VHRRRYFLGWLAVATVATAVALGTVELVRGAVGGETVVGALSPADVSAQLSAATTGGGGARSGTGAPTSPAATHLATGPSTPTGKHLPANPTPAARASHGPTPSHAAAGSGSPTPSPTPTQTSVTRLLTSAGGSVVARCTGSGHSAQVYLVSWSPAQGFTAHVPSNRGPAEEVEIEFESDSTSVTAHITCSSSGPVQTIETGGWGGGGDD
jgi:hypothetical protein